MFANAPVKEGSSRIVRPAFLPSAFSALEQNEAPPMHSLGWVLALAIPPFIALIVWRLVRFTEVGFPWQGVRLGKYGFWIIVTVIYSAILASALVEHKI
jgi:hypothetical protein